MQHTEYREYLLSHWREDEHRQKKKKPPDSPYQVLRYSKRYVEGRNLLSRVRLFLDTGNNLKREKKLASNPPSDLSHQTLHITLLLFSKFSTFCFPSYPPVKLDLPSYANTEGGI